ncbi:hypothetical protein DL98DRAFT_661450 [Cadophora sp. DSE1049]|nr:hypothetical protein DL98DRAFT_661450 [Cadophora sp. DSE1049]
MAEILGLAASIIAIVQIADRIVGACKFYIDSSNDYPKDLRLIYVEITSLKVAFDGLRFLDKDDSEDFATIQALGAPDGPLEACKTVITELSRLLPEAKFQLPSSSPGKRQRLDNALTVLAWPLKAQKARKLLDEIIHHKSTITLGLTGELLRNVRAIKTELDHVSQILTGSQRREVCNWFEKTNPSPNHNAARDLYEDGTGNWVLRSQEWIEWVSLQSRSLWMHGIPGAGKTVLAAHLIEQVQRLCHKNTGGKVTCVYFYCYHGHNQDEAAPFLRWLISQLFRQLDYIPRCAYDVFQEGKEPDIPALMSILEGSLHQFQTVFVMVDALDESQPREHLLKILHDIVTDQRFDRIQLFATSRDYIDIRRTMSGISQPLSMSNCLVEADIKHYISAMISSNPKFQRWPHSLRAEVVEILGQKAKGMFRWAVCQLDIIRRLDHPTKIRQALQNLPKTLDETYERIFSYIPEELKELVRHALHWVSFHNNLWEASIPLPASILVDGYALGNQQTNSEQEHHLVDLEMLKESCGCLVTFALDESTQSETAILAHFTVREYLESERTRQHSSFFRLVTNDSHAHISNTVLSYALACESDHGSIITLRLPQLDLRGYCLASSLQLIAMEKFVEPSLAFQFLDPSKPHYQVLRNRLLSSDDIDEELDPSHLIDSEIYFYQLDFDWCHRTEPVAAVFIQLLELKCYNLAAILLQNISVKKILEGTFSIGLERLNSFLDSNDAEPWKFHGTVLEYLATYTLPCNYPADKDLRFCCKYDAGLVNFATTLLLSIGWHSHQFCEMNGGCVPEMLLNRGALVDPTGFRVTPLQICCLQNDLVGVKLILRSGADPNRTGDQDGIEWGTDSMLGTFASLHGISPLRIVRTLDHGSKRDGRRGPEIENLLLEYGAQDFEL